MSVFGFSTEPSAGGDFLPILKYDARAGRIFRVDRIEDAGSFSSDPIDITQTFKAIFDFENLEVGWVNFAPGMAPDARLVPMGQALPERPSPQHKNGVRVMVKLAKECADGQAPIRELMGTSKAMLGGLEEAYLFYQNAAKQNPGKLPVLTLTKTVPITTGTGAKSSTNYKPIFKIVGWVARGDLAPQPRGAAPAQAQTNGGGRQQTPPATGASRATAPAEVSADDFG